MRTKQTGVATMNTYSIRCLKSTPNGFIEQILGKDCQWYSACNNGGFKTLVEARQFWRTADYELRGSSIWIRGPKGGRHTVTDPNKSR